MIAVERTVSVFWILPLFGIWVAYRMARDFIEARRDVAADWPKEPAPADPEPELTLEMLQEIWGRKPSFYDQDADA